jgi:hypothetical protein
MLLLFALEYLAGEEIDLETRVINLILRTRLKLQRTSPFFGAKLAGIIMWIGASYNWNSDGIYRNPYINNT